MSNIPERLIKLAFAIRESWKDGNIPFSAMSYKAQAIDSHADEDGAGLSIWKSGDSKLTITSIVRNESWIK